jgi:hypothetical protein
MSLKSSLMRYVEEKRLRSFNAHDDKKATLYLASGQCVKIYMATQYIIGEADVAEAMEDPSAEYLVYNTWDSVSNRAKEAAKQAGLEIYTFGGFGNILDRLNANP